MTSKMRDNLLGSKRLLNLWVEQKGICPICRQKITDDMQWGLHRITPQAEGGNNNVSNLQLVHYDCHRKFHRQKLEVVEPAA
jgi:RNA-directed DNA polymerase